MASFGIVTKQNMRIQTVRLVNPWLTYKRKISCLGTIFNNVKMYFKLFELNVGNINVVLQNNNDEGMTVSF